MTPSARFETALVHNLSALRGTTAVFHRPDPGSLYREAMNSRVHPKYKTKYRVTNWTEYDQALVKRGDITLWISPSAILAWTAKASGRRGAPRRYTDC